MHLFISPVGVIRLLYSEAIPLQGFGSVQVQRASHVEANAEGVWQADLRPVGGPVLGPFSRRSLALQAEEGWLTETLLAVPHTTLPSERPNHEPSSSGAVSTPASPHRESCSAI